MAKPLRPKRGTTAKNDAFTGLASEITIDTDKHSIRVHDGLTAGGHEILPKAKNDLLYEKAGRDPNDFLISATGTIEARKLADRFADVVNVKDFGAKGDGVADDTVAIKRAIDFATQRKKRVVFDERKVYKISSDLTFTYGANFNGSTLDVSESNAVVYFTTEGEWVADAEALSLLKNAATNEFAQNSVYVSAWKDYSEISNHYIRVWTSQPAYVYREYTKNRFEMNLVTRFGCLMSPVRASTLDKSTITRVDKLAFNKVQTVYEDVVIKLGSRDNGDYKNVIVYDASNVLIKNLSFDIDADFVATTTNPELIVIQNSCGVEVDCINGISSNPKSLSGSGYTYVFGLSRCYDAHVNGLKGQGGGWGAVGSNLSWRVKFENCDVNRIDFHEPVMEYLKVENCNLGIRGIGMTIFGDLTVNDCTFNTRNVPDSLQPAIISSRDELVGVCLGNATINNCRILIEDNATVALFRSYATPTDDSEYHEKRFFENIFVSNIRVDGGTLELCPQVRESADAYVVRPTQVRYLNISGKCRYTEGSGVCGLVPSGSGGYKNPNYHVSIENASGLVLFDMSEASKDSYPSLSLKNCSSGSDSPLWVRLRHPAKGVVESCVLDSVRFESTNPKRVTFTDCEFIHTGTVSDYLFSGVSQVGTRLENSVVHVASAAALTNASGFTALNIATTRIDLAGSEKDYFDITYVSGRPLETVLTVPAGMNIANNYVITGYLNNTFTYVPIDLHVAQSGVGRFVWVNDTTWVSAKHSGTSLTLSSNAMGLYGIIVMANT